MGNWRMCAAGGCGVWVRWIKSLQISNLKNEKVSQE